MTPRRKKPRNPGAFRIAHDLWNLMEFDVDLPDLCYFTGGLLLLCESPNGFWVGKFMVLAERV